MTTLVFIFWISSLYCLSVIQPPALQQQQQQQQPNQLVLSPFGNDQNVRLLRLADDLVEWVPEDLVNALISSENRKLTLLGNQSLQLLFNTLSDRAQQLLLLPSLGPGFIDETVDYPTDLFNSASISQSFDSELPKSIQHRTIVKKLIALVTTNRLNDTISFLSKTFKTRHANTQVGLDASNALFEKISNLIFSYGSFNSDISIERFIGKSSKQPSIIVKWIGSEFPDQVVVIGAHLDSTDGSYRSSVAPGADDDASGVACLLEVLHVLLSSKFRPKRTIHFISFAAEELGLLGSKDVAKSYRSTGVDVVAMLQMEMAGYSAGNKLTIIQDTSNAMSKYLSMLASEFLGSDSFRFGKCSYGCSDHASFSAAGYTSACIAEAGPFDSTLNPYIHTSRDVLEVLDMNFLKKFAQLGLSFVVEMSMTNDK